METTERTGLVIRFAVGPAFGHTYVKYMGVYIRQAWRKAERLSSSTKEHDDHHFRSR